MKNLVIVALAFTFGTTAHAEAISPAKAAELGLHRIERLVTLKKIDQNYIDFFSGISTQKLTPAQPTDPSFKVAGLQVAATDGKSNEVDIMMDATGKALSNSVKEGSTPANPPRWGNKDALAIGENSFHYLIDNAGAKPELRPFNTGFTSMALTQAQDAQGKPMARATMRSSATTDLLDVLLDLDGNVVSSTVRKQ
jgi:hypothetical protein